MMICKVTGTVTAPQKNAELVGKKLLVVQPLTLEGAKDGPALIAIDNAQAGAGDIVLVNKEGSGARLIFGNERIPVQAVVVGVIDGIALDETGEPDIASW